MTNTETVIITLTGTDAGDTDGLYTASLSETNAHLMTSGTLTVTDVWTQLNDDVPARTLLVQIERFPVM